MTRFRQRSVVAIAAGALTALFFAAGCAEKGPILLDVRYQAPEGKTATVIKTVVAISPVRDLREKPRSVLGKRVISEYLENDLVVTGTVADIATDALKEALRSRGAVVKESPDWSIDSRVPAVSGADIIIGGELKALWVESVSQPLKVQTKAVAQLRVSAARGKDLSVLRTLNLSSSIEREDFAFSFSMVEQALGEALTAAVNQLLNDEEFKKALQ